MQPNKPPPPAEELSAPASNGITPAKPVQPIRVHLPYPPARLKAKLAQGQAIYGGYGVGLDFAAPIELDRPELADIDRRLLGG
jgi:hypothetical protein